MTQPAFRATYADLKLIKTRGCVQIVFELPLADYDAAYGVLGGLPDSSRETWFGIAALAPSAKEVVQDQQQVDAGPRPPTKAGAARTPWPEVKPQAQAAIRASENPFWMFLADAYPDEWDETRDADKCLKLICGITSKADLAINHKARVRWHCLDSQYQVWGKA